MPNHDFTEFAPDQRLYATQAGATAARLADVVSAVTRPLDEQLAEISLAVDIWRLCDEDEALARRWTLAARGNPEIVERCIALGLEPEQLGRIALGALDSLDDQQLLDALATRPEPAWCACGWDEWVATQAGWECPHCHVEVRRDPRL